VTCPTYGVGGVIVGELHRGGRAMYACFEAAGLRPGAPAETSSAYLMLPSHLVRLAPSFIASPLFGSFQLHACFLSTTLVLPGGYRPLAHPLPS
jgi:hypothetical protein